MTGKKLQGLLSVLKGNHAELRVASWLSERCYVRPVSSGTDTGIDLYCETVDLQEAEPFLHFWVQVKSGSQVTSPRGVEFRFRYEKVRYWLRQPVPVYAWLVPPGPAPREQPWAHIVDFTRQVYAGAIPRRTRKKTIVLRPQFGIGGQHLGLEAFIEQIVKPDYVLRAAQLGVHSHLPQLRDGYIRRGLGGIYGPFADVAVEQIRRTASAALRDLLTLDNPDEQQERLMAVLADVLDPFTRARNRTDIRRQNYRGWHYGDLIALGLWLHHGGKLTEGNEMLRRAASCVRTDKRFKAGHPDADGLLAGIESLIRDPESPGP